MDWKQLVFPDEGQPNRTLGLICGLVGGLAGAYALRIYWRQVAPKVFPLDAQPVETPGMFENAAQSPFGQQYRPGESSAVAAGRLVYHELTGHEPASPEMRSLLGEGVVWAWGFTAGALYGGTRTTTRARDIAGGFFYGLRLFLGDTFTTAFLGLRADPRIFTLRQHCWRLSAHWVYSFTTTAVTRLLYRLVAPGNG